VTGPSHPAPVPEVALSRLDFHGGHTDGLYARTGLADCWIVHLPERVLEIHREPVADVSAPVGGRHASLTVLRTGGHAAPLHAAPLAVPAAPVAVADHLP